MDKKDAIYQATLTLVAKNGIGRISSKDLAKELKIAEGSIFYYFKTIRNLLDECAMRYDRELMGKCFQYIQEGKHIMDIWDILIEQLLNNPDGANFYFAYVYYYGFNPTELNERAEEFLKVARILFEGKEHTSDHNLLVYWDYITTQLFYYVNKISTGLLENTKENKEFIKKITFASYAVI